MSVTVIMYHRGMSRWQPDARGRLGQAAAELYVERGFEATTVADIAERAGLTERTFFRHFADKREVLFAGQDELLDLFVASVKAAPDDASPLEAVGAALQAAAVDFEPRRPWSQERGRVIAAHPGLQERELIKLAHMATAVAGALRERGVGEPAASLAAQSGITVFHVGFSQWIEPANARTFAEIMTAGLAELKVVVAGR
jgi:AcrR family transcriptional regulator